MSIYSELSILFKIAQQLNEIKYLEDEEEEKAELAKEFIDNCNNLFSLTNNTEDEEFMRNIFLKNNLDLIQWLKDNNYYDEKTYNYLDNLLKNLKENRNDNNNFEEEEEDEENKIEDNKNSNNNNILNSNDSSIYIIMQNNKLNNSNNNLLQNNIYNNNQFNNINNNIIVNNNNNNNFENNYNNNINSKNNENVKKINLNKIENEEEEDEDEGEEEEEEEIEENDNNNDDNDNDNNNNNNNDLFINKEEEIKNNKKQINIIQEKNNLNNNISESKEQFKVNNLNYIKNNNEEDNEEEEEENKFQNNNNYNHNNNNENDDDNSSSDSNNGKIEDAIDKFLVIPIKELFIQFHKKENHGKVFNNLYIQLNDIKQKFDKLDEKYKNKLITLICIIFPFCSLDQKKNLCDININKELEIYLSETLLYFDDKNNLYKYITDILKNIPNINKKKTQNFNFEKIGKNLFLDSKNELFMLYQFLIVYKAFGSKNDKNKATFDNRYFLKNFYFISFKIYFILTHQEYYSCISENILDVYEKLLFIKKFYTKSLINKLKKPYIISKLKNNGQKDEIKYKYDNFILGDKNNIENIDIKELFDEDEYQLNKEVFKVISHFYKVDENNGLELLKYSNQIIYGKNYNFIANIVDIIYTKKWLIFKNFKKNNIFPNLEKNIKKISKILFINGENNKYSMNNKIKNIFYELVKEIKLNIKGIKLKNEDIKFYPVGSLTEFLFFNDIEKSKNDLNIYLDIHKLKPQARKDVLIKIYEYLKKYNVKKKKSLYESLCFDFVYNNLYINLIILGFGPYIHSILFREYSLMDSRFPILGLTLKYFLEKIGLNDHNTFVFISLLSTFLQDIIQPPILPKIFSDQISEIFPYKLPFPNYYENKISLFIDNLQYNYIIHIPKNILDKEKLRKIYNDQIGKNKNNLTCSQLFLYFLEFLIYYFKYDTLYVNCSLQNEGFDSMNNILNEEEDDDENIRNNLDKKYPNDIYFKEFFKNNYYKKRNERRDINHNKKGFILLRDPVNPFYNPGDILSENLFEKYFTKIKKGHDILLNTGDFENLVILK